MPIYVHLFSKRMSNSEVGRFFVGLGVLCHTNIHMSIFSVGECPIVKLADFVCLFFYTSTIRLTKKKRKRRILSKPTFTILLKANHSNPNPQKESILHPSTSTRRGQQLPWRTKHRQTQPVPRTLSLHSRSSWRRTGDVTLYPPPASTTSCSKKQKERPLNTSKRLLCLLLQLLLRRRWLLLQLLLRWRWLLLQLLR